MRMDLGRARKSRFATAACAALLLAACGAHEPPDTRAADEAAIRDLDKQFSQAAGAKDVEKSIAFYSDDAIVMAPNAPAATTKEAIREGWSAMLGAMSTLSWEATNVEVARSGELAYATGPYETTAIGPDGNPVTDRGKFLEVWKKQPDGNWKVVADMFNSDLPPPAAAPATK